MLDLHSPRFKVLSTVSNLSWVMSRNSNSLKLYPGWAPSPTSNGIWILAPGVPQMLQYYTKLVRRCLRSWQTLYFYTEFTKVVVDIDSFWNHLYIVKYYARCLLRVPRSVSNLFSTNWQQMISSKNGAWFNPPHWAYASASDIKRCVGAALNWIPTHVNQFASSQIFNHESTVLVLQHIGIEQRSIVKHQPK